MSTIDQGAQMLQLLLLLTTTAKATADAKRSVHWRPSLTANPRPSGFSNLPRLLQRQQGRKTMLVSMRGNNAA
jgi:hypothetical protein